MSIRPNTEILINETHNNKYLFVLDRIPTSHLISKFSSAKAEYCIASGMAPADLSVERLRELNQDVHNFNLMLQSIEMPSLDLGYSVNPTQYVDIPHVEGKLTYGELTTSVKIDENWLVYDMLYYWFLAGHNPVEHMKYNEKTYANNFYVGGTLIILDNDMEKCKEFSFTDLHPVAMPSINLTDIEAAPIIIPVTWIHTGFVPSDNYVIKRV